MDSSTDRGDSVESSVSADAEVRAGDIVGDGGRNDHHWNAQLLVLLPALDQLQAANKGLQVGRHRRSGQFRWEYIDKMLNKKYRDFPKERVGKKYTRFKRDILYHVCYSPLGRLVDLSSTHLGGHAHL